MTEQKSDMTNLLRLQVLPDVFCVCKVKDYSGADLALPFVFTGSTDEECSPVCPEKYIPQDTVSPDRRAAGLFPDRHPGGYRGDPCLLPDQHIRHFHVQYRLCPDKGYRL